MHWFECFKLLLSLIFKFSIKLKGIWKYHLILSTLILYKMTKLFFLFFFFFGFCAKAFYNFCQNKNNKDNAFYGFWMEQKRRGKNKMMKLHVMRNDIVRNYLKLFFLMIFIIDLHSLTHTPTILLMMVMKTYRKKWRQIMFRLTWHQEKD